MTDKTVYLEPDEDLIGAIVSENASYLCIAGSYDRKNKTIMLCSADFKVYSFPLAWLDQHAGVPVANPNKLSIGDWGHSICLGKFELLLRSVMKEFPGSDLHD